MSRLVPPDASARRPERTSLPPGRRLTGVLPGLQADDPIVQYLGLCVGDLVCIHRHDGSLYYRLVIATK